MKQQGKRKKWGRQAKQIIKKVREQIPLVRRFKEVSEELTKYIEKHAERDSQVFEYSAVRYYIEKYCPHLRNNPNYPKNKQIPNHFNVTHFSAQNNTCLRLGVPFLLRQAPYEPLYPTILFNINNLYNQQLRHLICSLANTSFGGNIILADQIDNFAVKKGFSFIQPAKVDNLKQKIEQVIKSIRCGIVNFCCQIIEGSSLLKITIEALPIYQNPSVENLGSKELVIKISVRVDKILKREGFPKPIFYIMNHLANYMPTFEFCSCQLEEINPNQFVCGYRKLQQNQIYERIMNRTKINKYYQIVRKEEILFQHQVQRVSIVGTNISENILYHFSNDARYFFCSFLKAINEDQLGEHFELDSQHSKLILQLQIDPKQEQNLLLQQLLQQLQLKPKQPHWQSRYRLLLPLPQCQKSVIRYKEKQKERSCYYYYLIMYEVPKELGNSQIKNMINERFRQINAEIITQKIKVSSCLQYNEIELLRTFVYDKFLSLPKIQRKKQLNSDQYTDVEIYFPTFEMNAAIFTYFLMSVTNKRPTYLIKQKTEQNSNLISQQKKKTQQKRFNNPKTLMGDLLTYLEKYLKEEQFGRLQDESIIIQIQLPTSEKSQRTIHKISQLLGTQRIPKIVFPLGQLQKQLNNAVHDQKKYYQKQIYYLIYPTTTAKSGQALEQELLEKLQLNEDLKNGVGVYGVYERIGLGPAILKTELELFLAFVLRKFKYRVEKSYTSTFFKKTQYYKNIELGFLKQSGKKNQALVASLFIWTVLKKRPKCWHSEDGQNCEDKMEAKI